MGNERMTWGTYSDAAPAGGGDINTRLRLCTKIVLQPYGSAVATNASVVNETLPVADGYVDRVGRLKEEVRYGVLIHKERGRRRR
jgi:hypothetical protein